ncbi:hypothetical protein COLO4_33207 [Corchorus olitorius]|uniref:Prolamin-like domain-containing protein n=1 Tax=Corchorus olitorius TaxID=93759 RepID=A0A1R3GVL2_9ROSI|nr:hypothetical protein COLO4_33207 [Corchorus olitorius]
MKRPIIQLPFLQARAAAAAEVTDAKGEVALSPQEILKVTIPPEPQPGLYRFLEECTKKLSRKCGEMAVTSILQGSATTAACCREVVGIGKNCHDDMIKFFVSLPELHLKASDIYPKSDRVWNRCVKAAASKPPRSERYINPNIYNRLII